MQLTAAHGAAPAVVDRLLHAYPRAKSQPNTAGRLPLHLAIEHGVLGIHHVGSPCVPE
jgi:hypothetical protein